MGNQLYRGDALIFLSEWEAIQKGWSGEADLIYLDIPFGTGRNFNSFQDKPLEKVLLWKLLFAAYKRLKATGSMYVHCDYRLSWLVHCYLDGIFGGNNFLNEIIWHYGLGNSATTKHFPRKHDNIYLYSKSNVYTFNAQRGQITPAMESRYSKSDEGGRFFTQKGRKYYLKGGKYIDDVWDIPSIAPIAKERLKYPTQKPEKLLERIITVSSNPGDVVADFMCGSGTTLAVAHKLGREWVGCDSSQEAIKITTQRLENLGAKFERRDIDE